MKTFITQLRYRLAFWLVRMLATKDAMVIPATTLAALEAKVQETEGYVSVHSGRLNDGTTRTVRRKLRNRCQEANDLAADLRAYERLSLAETR